MTAAALPLNVTREEVVEAQASHSRDYAALLILPLVVIFYHVTDVALREDSQIGLAFRNAALRRVLWILFATTAALLAAWVLRPAENASRKPTGLVTVLNWVAALLVGAFVLNVGVFVWTGTALVNAAPLSSTLEIGALAAVVILAAPWERLALWRRTLRQIAPAILIALIVLIMWEMLINIFQIKQFLLPRPTAISQNLLDTFPDLISKSWVTFQNALWGYAIGCGAGILIGLISARFSGLSRAILPFAIAANSTPIIAFAPIMGFWFGVLNPASKIAIVAIMVFFPCMINTVKGLLSADQGAIELMRSLAVPELSVFRKVRFPAALPFIFNGLKFGTTWSVIGAVVGEFFGGSTQGIGFYIKNKPANFDFAAAWSAIVVVSLLGILFYMVVSLLERVIMPWHVSFRQQTN